MEDGRGRMEEVFLMSQLCVHACGLRKRNTHAKVVHARAGLLGSKKCIKVNMVRLHHSCTVKAHAIGVG